MLTMERPAVEQPAVETIPVRECCGAPINCDHKPGCAQRGDIVMVEEVHRCPRCEAAIPPECVRGEPVEAGYGRLHRRIRVYCGGCKAGFERTYRYADGRLVAVSNVALVMGESLRELRGQIDELMGDRGREVLTNSELNDALIDAGDPGDEPLAAVAEACMSLREQELAQLQAAIGRTERQLLALRDRERDLVRKWLGSTLTEEPAQAEATVTLPDPDVADASLAAADVEYVEQQRTLDREFGQRTAFSETEPGRSYEE